MKMEIAMTERDKKLLIFLGIFVVVVCFGYWGVLPSVKKIGEMNEKIKENEDIQMMNDLKIAELPMLMMENDELEEKIVSARSNYFPMMTSAEVDRYFTDLALQHNLYAYDLNIVMPKEYCQLEPYQYSEKALTYVPEEVTEVTVPEDDSDDEDGDSESAEPVFEEDESETGIYAVGVTMRMTGEQADIMRMVNELSHNKKQMRVCAYSYSTKRKVSIEEGAYDVLEDLVLDISVELYMCEE